MGLAITLARSSRASKGGLCARRSRVRDSACVACVALVIAEPRMSATTRSRDAAPLRGDAYGRKHDAHRSARVPPPSRPRQGPLRQTRDSFFRLRFRYGASLRIRGGLAGSRDERRARQRWAQTHDTPKSSFMIVPCDPGAAGYDWLFHFAILLPIRRLLGRFIAPSRGRRNPVAQIIC